MDYLSIPSNQSAPSGKVFRFFCSYLAEVVALFGTAIATLTAACRSCCRPRPCSRCTRCGRCPVSSCSASYTQPTALVSGNTGTIIATVYSLFNSDVTSKYFCISTDHRLLGRAYVLGEGDVAVAPPQFSFKRKL